VFTVKTPPGALGWIVLKQEDGGPHSTEDQFVDILGEREDALG